MGRTGAPAGQALVRWRWEPCQGQLWGSGGESSSEGVKLCRKPMGGVWPRVLSVPAPMCTSAHACLRLCVRVRLAHLRTRTWPADLRLCLSAELHVPLCTSVGSQHQPVASGAQQKPPHWHGKSCNAPAGGAWHACECV